MLKAAAQPLSQPGLMMGITRAEGQSVPAEGAHGTTTEERTRTPEAFSASHFVFSVACTQSICVPFSQRKKHVLLHAKYRGTKKRFARCPNTTEPPAS